MGEDNNQQSLDQRLKLPSAIRRRPVFAGGIVLILGAAVVVTLFGADTGSPSAADDAFAVDTKDQTDPTVTASGETAEPGDEPALIVDETAGVETTLSADVATADSADGSASEPTKSEPDSSASSQTTVESEPQESDTTSNQAGGASETGTTSTTDRPATTTTPPSAASMPTYGFSPGGWFPDEPDAKLDADLDDMVAAGARWLRIDFDWSKIEGNEGVYHWHRTDRVIDAASARGLKVLGLIGQSPSWARPTGLGSNAGPTDPADYARFAAAATERYQNRGVEAWELWNEPNLAMFWGPKPDPVAYAELVRPAVAAMRAVDPQVTIISGGLAPAADEPDGSGISPITFTSRMLDAGADIFDGYAIHPYSYPARPIDPSTAAWNPFHNLPVLRDLLESKGQGGKPIWLTEYGAPTGTSQRAVSEAEQSAQIIEALAAADGWSWTGPLFLYAHRDERNAPSDFQSNFGLRFNDGSPKQAWTDLLAMANA